jgi:hypothetical protein
MDGCSTLAFKNPQSADSVPDAELPTSSNASYFFVQPRWITQASSILIQ